MAQGTEQIAASAELVASKARALAVRHRPGWLEHEKRLFILPAVVIILALSIFPSSLPWASLFSTGTSAVRPKAFAGRAWRTGLSSGPTSISMWC